MRQYTREVSTDLGAKITIRIEADNNQAVVLKDDDLGTRPRSTRKPPTSSGNT